MFSWSVRRVFALVSASLLLLLTTAGVASAQGPPQKIWIAPNPGGIATSAGAVAWSPSDDLPHRRDRSARSLDAGEESLGR